MERSSFIFSGGEDYKDSEFDVEEEKPETSKKKKKSPISKLWDKLFNKESDQPKEEQKKFLTSFSSFFSRIVGLEKESVEYADRKSSSSSEYKQVDIRLPLLNDVDTSTLINEETVEFTNHSSLDSTTQQNSYENQEYQNEQLAEVDEPRPDDNSHLPDQMIDSTVDLNEYYNSLVDDQLSSDQSSEENIQLDNSTSEQFNNLQTSDRAEASDNQIEHKQPIIKEREIVIEKRKEVGGATLLALLVADKLSKSTEKKLQSEAKQLQKKVKRLETIEKNNFDEIGRLRNQSQKQAEQLRDKRRTISSDKSHNKSVVSKAKKDIFYNAGVDKIISSSPEIGSDSNMATPVASRYSKEFKEKTPTSSVVNNFDNNNNRKSSALLEQTLDTTDKHSAFERYIDRRPEVKEYSHKDINTKVKTSVEGVAQKEKLSNSGGNEARLIKQQEHRLNKQQKQLDRIQQEYRQAIKYGAMAGIIMLVSFALVVFLWSLFN